jgi:beta-lactamase regulating signal transducer with metallopeptidase domain
MYRRDGPGQSALHGPRTGSYDAANSKPTPEILLGVWACGFIGITVAWWVRWRRLKAAARAGKSLRLDIPIRAVSSPTLLEPGVFGIFRPVLLLPEGIFDRLTTAQLQAVIAHELSHVRHRDNLIASIHTVDSRLKDRICRGWPVSFQTLLAVRS